MFSIVAIDQNLGIGFENKILYHNPVDMFIFKTFSMLINNCLVGRVTYETLPPSVKNLRNLIPVSRSSPVVLTDQKYLVIGGSQIYSLFSNDIKVWIITTHKESSEIVDSFFCKKLYESIIKDFHSLELYEDEDILVEVYFRS